MLLAINVSQVPYTDALRLLYASLVLVAAVFGLSFVFFRNWQKAALITSLFLMLFFSYGHLFSVSQGLHIGPVLIGRTLVLLPLYILILAICTWWLATRPTELASFTQSANWISLILLVFPLYTISSYYLQADLVRASQNVDVAVELKSKFNGEPPTIYYIILDMHARTDVLKNIYGYDNSWFINALKEKGFYIAEASTSNYSSTLQSISSSLNMDYINDLTDQYGRDSNNLEPLGLLLEHNRLMNEFRKSGYQIGSLQSDFFHTEFRDADLHIKPSPDEVRQYQNFWSLNSFEGLFVHTTALRVLYDLGIASSDSKIVKTLETPYQLHRLTILNTLEHLPDFAKQDQPFFVFAHVVAPHPPYVFGPNGEEIAHDQPFSLSGPPRQNGGQKYMDLYVGQLQYIDRRILEVVEAILAQSKAPPIIIIQGDHGPVSYLGEDEVEKSNMQEQHAILNAYYFPNQKYDLLYPSVSPVNSFRIVFNTFFDGDFELLPDENYFIPHARPYDFIDVTDRVKSDLLTP